MLNSYWILTKFLDSIVSIMEIESKNLSKTCLQFIPIITVMEDKWEMGAKRQAITGKECVPAF